MFVVFEWTHSDLADAYIIARKNALQALKQAASAMYDAHTAYRYPGIHRDKWTVLAQSLPFHQCWLDCDPHGLT